jgi:formamidopyrimidine-DNA glycosylase
MPELPEVQTTVSHLVRHVPGRTIVNSWMDPKKPVHTGSNMAWPAIRRHITGRRITGVTRRAKYIVIGLSGGLNVWIHQKMTGHLLLGSWVRKAGQWASVAAEGPLADPMNRHIRMIVTLDDGTQIALSDTRRFAKVILTRADAEVAHIKELAHLGPEPLVLSTGQFTALFKGKRGLIKPLLMNPSFIVGIGNIYADEILHRAGVHPFARTETLSQKDLTGIYRTMRTVLATAIRQGGSSTHDYRTPDGTKGGYQKRHLAYQQTGQRCTLCQKGIIERRIHGGRSSHFCPVHQLI